jgi:uncharacterized protein
LFDPRLADVRLLSQTGATVQGRAPLAAMSRLRTALSASTDGEAAWSAQGSETAVAAGPAQIWLHLQANAVVPLECQRCLQTMVQAVQVDRRFRFVAGEAEAARLDEECEDDVLPLQPRLDLLELLEDELILALPIVPRHETCPEPLPLPADTAAEEEPAPHPFAGLAALRGRTGKGES